MVWDIIMMDVKIGSLKNDSETYDLAPKQIHRLSSTITRQASWLEILLYQCQSMDRHMF